MADHYDILIIGGGMVGASLAVALRDTPLKVAIVEAAPLDGGDSPSFDTRAIALSQGSKRIFDTMGVWQAMEQLGVTAIRDIHVSDRGHFGTTHLSSSEERVEALGYVAEAGVMGRGLQQGLDSAPAEVIAPAALTGLEIDEAVVRATVELDGSERTLTASLLVAADGGRSTVRSLMGDRTFDMPYGQSAVIANVVTDRPHRFTAYERFTDSGPLAMLPNTAPGYAEDANGERRWSLVWTVHDHELDTVLGYDDATFLERLNRRLGRRVGRVEQASPRYAYPLGLQAVREPVRRRLVYIGNAAHTIHPVGGQGFNLGLRDVAALAEVVSEAAASGEDIGGQSALKRYKGWRKADYARVFGFTDGLARLFSNRIPPLVVARNAGLLAMELFPSARHAFARQAMGLNGKLPRLARGLPITAPGAEQERE